MFRVNGMRHAVARPGLVAPWRFLCMDNNLSMPLVPAEVHSSVSRLFPLQKDRIFFSLAGLWFVALTFVGFSRSFYFRVLPEPLPAHQIVHGVVYSIWVALFLVQALLISAHRTRWHIA